MLGLFFSLILLCLLFYIGFLLTGAVIAALFWVFIRLPVAIFLVCLGIVLCMTLLLIPLGVLCFRGAIRVLV